jgi:protein SCO1/2
MMPFFMVLNDKLSFHRLLYYLLNLYICNINRLKNIKMKNTSFLAFTLLLSLIWGCQNNDKTLPVLGEKRIEEKIVNGKKVVDSLNHKIGSFNFKNQYGKVISEKTVEGKVYIADFFFTSCPSICPVIKGNMKKVYNKYKNQKDFMILSYSIDPKRDTVGRLSWYANKLNVKSEANWHFLTDGQTDINKLAAEYLSFAAADENEPGGFGHSPYILLIDRQRQVRGAYDGTDTKKVEELIKDISILLNEKSDK